MHTCVHVHTHSHTNIKKFTYQYKFYCPMLLRDNCKNYKNVHCLTKVSYHTGMPLHACILIHVHTSPTHINIDPTKSIHSKVYKFMVMAETSTFGILHGRNVRGRNVLAVMSVTEMSVAEISYIRMQNPKNYRKVPKFSGARIFAVIHLKFKQRGQT